MEPQKLQIFDELNFNIEFIAILGLLGNRTQVMYYKNHY